MSLRFSNLKSQISDFRSSMLASVLLCGAVGHPCPAAPEPAVLDALSTLQRLPLPHHLYLTGVDGDAFYAADHAAAAEQIVRVLGSVPLRLLDGANADRLAQARAWTQRYDCGVALSYAPYMYTVAAGAPPSAAGAAPMDLQAKLIETLQSAWPDVPVTCILLDCERWKGVDALPLRERVALTARYDESTLLWRAAWPAAPLVWYDRGNVNVAGDEAAGLWQYPSRLFVGDERGDVVSAELYRPHDAWATELTLQSVAAAHPAAPLQAWIALGAAWDWSSGRQVWAADFAPRLDAYYWLGRRLCAAPRYPPWSRVAGVAIYRTPFADAAAGRAFIAYARGATGASGYGVGAASPQEGADAD